MPIYICGSVIQTWPPAGGVSQFFYVGPTKFQMGSKLDPNEPMKNHLGSTWDPKISSCSTKQKLEKQNIKNEVLRTKASEATLHKTYLDIRKLRKQKSSQQISTKQTSTKTRATCNPLGNRSKSYHATTKVLGAASFHLWKKQTNIIGGMGKFRNESSLLATTIGTHRFSKVFVCSCNLS